MNTTKTMPPLATLLGCIALAMLPALVAAQPAPEGPGVPPPARSGLADHELEPAYWACDHAATVSMLDAPSAMYCGQVTEDLLQRRFGGDFDAMLAWWRENKSAQHAALEARRAAAAAQAAQSPPRGPSATRRPAPPVEARAASPLQDATPEELKAAYLYCDRLATTERFDSDAAASCSIVYEALKARVFGGSTERLIAWWRQQTGQR
jgi:hypothetical protein